ncbi:hypothetical protein CDAR_518551 [Caerostris darwini]|uniref:Uncharacterized protein n=1 Tax=Caerostris darwini TaxID=1538125 RepID=A0AAV4UVH8_9ARAC|nr:hypothetical protein CDAR_518551 [Caerostris darwini]
MQMAHQHRYIIYIVRMRFYLIRMNINSEDILEVAGSLLDICKHQQGLNASPQESLEVLVIWINVAKNSFARVQPHKSSRKVCGFVHSSNSNLKASFAPRTEHRRSLTLEVSPD